MGQMSLSLRLTCLHCLSALVVVPTDYWQSMFDHDTSSLHCLSALVVVPTIDKGVRLVGYAKVFIAFRRWSWFRPTSSKQKPKRKESVFIAFRRWSWFRHYGKRSRLSKSYLVFIAFRRWSWFRLSASQPFCVVKPLSSLPFGVGRGSDL